MRKMMTSFKRAIAACMCAAMTMSLLAGCGAKSKTASNPEKEVNTYICIGTPDAQISAALTIADKKGFDIEEGVDLQIKFIQSGPDLAAVVAGGGCDIAFASNYSVMTWLNADLDMKVIAVNDNMGGTQAAAIRDEIKLSSPKDLEGLKLGLLPGSEVEVAFKRLCEDYDVDYDKIEKVAIQPADQLSAFEKGEIDILSCWEPWITYAEQNGGRFLLSGTKCAIDGVPENVDWMNIYSTISVSSKMLADNREDLAKVLRAINKATDFINTNRDEAVSILSEEFEIEKESLTNIMTRNIYEFGPSDTYVESQNWLYDYLVETGTLTKVMTYDDIHDFSLLKETLPGNYKITK